MNYCVDRLERASNYVNDGERNPLGAAKSGGSADYGDLGFTNRANESVRGKLIPLHGCGTSEASQLLNNRMLYLFCIFVLVEMLVQYKLGIF